MKRLPKIIMHLIIGCILVIVTIGTLYGIHRASKNNAENEMFGWLQLAGGDLVINITFLVAMLAVFIIDTMWILYLLMILIKKLFRIKDEDRTIYLP